MTTPKRAAHKAETALSKGAAWVQAHTTLTLTFVLGFIAGAMIF